MRTKTIIISPSGKFYGSEQTLFTFLTNTSHIYTIYGKREKIGLKEKVLNNSNHRYRSFDNLVVLYLRIVLQLILWADTVYVNEGGHIRYLKLLAKFFPKKKFVIHIRLSEDTKRDRIAGKPQNLELISVTRFIHNLIVDEIQLKTQIISSPFRGSSIEDKWNFQLNTSLKIGIVGRVSKTKGIHELLKLFQDQENKQTQRYEFHFFGDIIHSETEVSDFLEYIDSLKNVKCTFHGFVSDKDMIYSSIDMLLHVNKSEPHGVIFLESLNYCKPIVGFNQGGIGEIASNLGLTSYMLNEDNWFESFDKTVSSINVTDYQKARHKMFEFYSIHKYVTDIEEKILSSEI